MFTEGTPFDLQMHLLRIPVRVVPTFWIMSAVLGWNPDRLDLVFLWVMCVFFSVLFHELGHALTAAALGYDPEIVLTFFGGYAQYQPGRDFGPFRSLMITLAGPLPQFMLGVLLLLTSGFIMHALEPYLDDRAHEYISATVGYLTFINIGWAILNLIPVLPLDGGRAVEAILWGAGLRDSRGVSLKLSIGVGALTAAAMFHFGITGTAILFMVLTISNLQELQSRRW